MAKLIPVFIMGKKYDILEGLTILKAFEYAGYQVVRGCGCRAGACGACATIYRVMGDYELKVGLACQTPVVPNMYLTQIPFFPSHRAVYALEKPASAKEMIETLYPEIKKCIGCNSCAHLCPQSLIPLDYVRAAYKGDIVTGAHLSFECIMCGLCATRCPAGIVPYQVGILVRRLYGRYFVEKSDVVANRCEEIRQGKYEDQISQLKAMSVEELKELYDKRDIVKKKF